MLKPNSDTLNRRSWESPQLSSRIEEEIIEPQELELEESNNSVKSQESSVKIEKESMFSKLKNFRKGLISDSIKYYFLTSLTFQIKVRMISKLH